MRRALLGLGPMWWGGGEGKQGQGNSADSPLPMVFVSQHAHLPHAYMLNETFLLTDKASPYMSILNMYIYATTKTCQWLLDTGIIALSLSRLSGAPVLLKL